ncbi:Hypothetical predicted protein [Scomber scombrus]|uniref:Uncharacterized protein n=1 Tax=Scomber scombrus TaxID=13677 RepID=A0AAV1NKZ3_SCOSC
MEARAGQIGGARAQLVSLIKPEREREVEVERARGRRVQSGGYHRTLLPACTAAAGPSTSSNKRRTKPLLSRLLLDVPHRRQFNHIISSILFSYPATWTDSGNFRVI